MNRLAACRIVARQLSTSGRAPAEKAMEIHPAYLKVRKNYEKFQVNNGVPIHLKGGAVDYALYSLTLTINLVGLVMMGDFFYRMAFK
ncbi:Cytochrome c oxidase subunit VIIa [Trinorchestia longiramus]|nr:Cytochrome c oxidase subunit VIIa [Trinorchestia longiramus]